MNGDPEWAGDFDAGVRIGVWSLYRWGRHLDSQGPMVDGVADGEWTTYHPSGERKAKGRFSKGQRVGAWQEYFSTGEPWRQVTYVDGAESSPRIDACRRLLGSWEADGDTRPLGCLVCRPQPDASILQVGVGLWRYWHPSGALEKEGELAEGKPNGAWRFFYDNTQPMLEGTFRNGKEDGRWVGAYRDGRPRFRGAYQAGKPEGEWRSFLPDGGVLSVGRYTGGSKVGTWRYEEHGKLEEVDYSRFDAGQLE